MTRVVALLLGTVGLAAMITGAAAQSSKTATKPPVASTPASAAPVSTEPANTSATYGDWVLRCQRLGDADKAKKFCEVAEHLQVAGQQSPVAELALGHLPGETAIHLTVVVPPSISFPSMVAFSGGDGQRGAVELQWRRCLPGGCFADAVVSDEALKAWRAEADAGKMTFKDAGGREIALPVSFRGLAQALDALAKS